MSTHLVTLPHLVTIIIVNLLDFKDIKALRVVCSVTKEWVENDWGFWNKTKFSRIEFPWFRQENYSTIWALLQRQRSPTNTFTLSFSSFKQTHFYPALVFSRLCEFINTQFANTCHFPRTFSSLSSFLYPKSNLELQIVYPTAEQDRSRRFPGKPLHYNLDFIFEFDASGSFRKYQINYALIKSLVEKSKIREQSRLDGVRELILTIKCNKGTAGNGKPGLEKAIIGLRCKSSVDRRGCTGLGAPQEIFQTWPRESIERDISDEEKCYREYYVSKILH